MAVGDWNILKPGGQDLVSTVDNQIREDKETLLSALSKEHNFEASDTTCDHKEGSGKAWVDVAANRSLRDSSRGRLFVETDTHKLYYGDTEDAWQWFAPKRNANQRSFIPTGGESTASAVWNNIPEGEDDWKVEITTTSDNSQLFITGSATLKSTVSGKNLYAVLAVDGTRVTNSDNPGGQAIVKYADGETTICLNRLVTDGDNDIDLSAGLHTITMEWKVDADGEASLVGNITASLVVEEI